MAEVDTVTLAVISNEVAHLKKDVERLSAELDSKRAPWTSVAAILIAGFALLIPLIKLIP
jgi:uncharacterized small protein (DUF1192 family)